MEVQHPEAAEVSAPDLAYDRAAVLRYLDEADAARERLRSELDEALRRLRDAQRGTPGTVTSALAEELCDLTERLDHERQVTWSDVQGIVAEAQREADAILAAARADARRLRTEGSPTATPSGWSSAAPPAAFDVNAGVR